MGRDPDAQGRLPTILIAYASRTGTRRNLAALKAADWRLMVSATGVWRHEGFPYAIDSGAWTAHQQGEPFNFTKYEGVLRWGARDADFVVLPDIVAGGHDSLRLSLDWLPRIEARMILIPAQDGLEAEDLRPYLSPRVGVFIGGSTEFKESTAFEWGRMCRYLKAWCHMGRVNSRRRIRLARLCGCHSFDGTSATRFAKTLPRLDAEVRQEGLWLK